MIFLPQPVDLSLAFEFFFLFYFVVGVPSLSPLFACIVDLMLPKVYLAVSYEKLTP